MPATPLTADVLAALERIGCPVSTTDVMRWLNRHRTTPLVVDQVYRALEALRSRGAVQRLTSASNKRIRYWDIATSNPCRCGGRTTPMTTAAEHRRQSPRRTTR
jgi:Fe2+ or Zn2+ uptake regulation protein